jgi:hypothetical protein
MYKTIKRSIVIAALATAVTLTPTATPTPTVSAATQCSTWANQLSNQRAPLTTLEYDYLMHTYGCRQPRTTWVAQMTTCGKYARRYREAGYSLTRIIKYTAAKGCTHFEDGAWG